MIFLVLQLQDLSKRQVLPRGPGVRFVCGPCLTAVPHLGRSYILFNITRDHSFRYPFLSFGASSYRLLGNPGTSQGMPHPLSLQAAGNKALPERLHGLADEVTPVDRVNRGGLCANDIDNCTGQAQASKISFSGPRGLTRKKRTFMALIGVRLPHGCRGDGHGDSKLAHNTTPRT